MDDLAFLHKDSFLPQKYKKMVKNHYENGDIFGWFDYIYQSANGDFSKVFWADLEPSPYLVSWLKEKPIQKPNKKACVIGCGVGDDAQALSEFGFEVVAFDISKTAIDLCKKRYPNSKINYMVADLFDYPKEWNGAFDLVYECNTLQVLPDNYRQKAREKMSSLIAKDGYILVSCRSREEGEKEDEIPKPLAKSELDKFVTKDKLTQVSFLDYDDNQVPSIPHYFAVYKKIFWY